MRLPIDSEPSAADLLDVAEALIRARGAHEIGLSELGSAAGVPTALVARHFADRQALYEAIAERWFSDITAAMEAVVASDLPVRDKMVAFFTRRMEIKLARLDEDAALFRSYLALGDANHGLIDGYIDLAGHYLSVIVSEAMAEGYFAGRTIDELVPLIELMTVAVCDPHMLLEHRDRASEETVRRIVDVIFAGLSTQAEPRAALRLAS